MCILQGKERGLCIKHRRTHTAELTLNHFYPFHPLLSLKHVPSTLQSSRIPVIHVYEERRGPLYFKRLKGSLHGGGNTSLPIQNFKLCIGFSKMFRFAGRWSICQRCGAIKQFVASGMIINNNELKWTTRLVACLAWLKLRLELVHRNTYLAVNNGRYGIWHIIAVYISSSCYYCYY